MSGTGAPRTNQRGIPDSLLVGLLAFLLGLTVLVWTATGLGGLFTHGAWPPGVSFTHSPMALRALVTAPHDLPGAWPDTPPPSLSGYGLFWGLLIGELLIAVVLIVFALGTFTRWRAVRARARTAGHPTGARPVAQPAAGTDPYPAHGFGAPPLTAPYPAQPVRPAYPAQPVGHPVPAEHPQSPYAPVPPHPEHVQAPQDPQPVRSQHLPEPAPLAQLPSPSTGLTPAPVEHIPTPRAEQPPASRLFFGSPDTRRPRALQAIQDAEGAALVVTSDPVLWAETKDARAKLGPVHVYDPTHRCDTPARLHWSPTAGCEDPETAAARAIALLAPVRPQARVDAAMADTAETLLRSWLHAAALESRDGRATKQLHRWAQGTAAHEPVRILRTHPKAQSGGAGLLESALTAYPERREIARELTARALACLSSIHIREACTPNRADSLALESFVNEGGTLYVVGEAIEDPRSDPAAMPLLTALASDVVERGRRMAERSSDGRLDPPMTLVLDDVAAVAPLPRLPELLSSGQDRGMPPLVLLRSPEQARARWSEALA
ncbi:type VI secretion protein [Streptomyces sp. NBC_00083]|uniref:type VI secretion protein n=1 Tax=Streptomyces sp. NBC_00083 TaxID=2975647 RepID=UPI00224FEF27|nr:type VI secretion protein [Streptomyces sp. NBC_00083]MCX5387764.1 type VI secretion protein [Streptomyces sp. NBC_00083]